MRKLLASLGLVGSLLGGGVASAYERPVTYHEPAPVVERVEVERPVIERDVYRRRLPPPPVVERVGHMRGYSWVRGEYRRFNHHWVWIPGHYQRIG